MGIIEKYNKPFEYAGVLMSLIIAYQFLCLWTNPLPTDASKILSMATLMAFEFIMVHSGVFMVLMPRKISLYVLIPFYGLFALAFTASMGSYDIAYIYLIVVFNRMRFAFSDVSNTIKSKAILMSVIAAVSYFVLIFLTAITDGFFFGEIELTEQFLNNIKYFDDLSVTGDFVERPHTAISFGFVYYCTIALFQAWLINKTQKKLSKNER